ncbi:aldose 1-epimerase [Exophiala dermatitidis]
MRCSIVQALITSTAVVPVFGQTSTNSSSPSGTTDPFAVYTISAENITAKFIPYGARLTSLLVPDRDGQYQDVAVGYDNATQYLTDTETNHTYFGAVVGRFANRIKNSTFTLNGNTYHIPANENGGADTLHGGTVGYDQRNWTVVTSSNSSVTFSLLDTGFEGFPGTVLTTATFTVESYPSGPQGQMRPRFTSNMVSQAIDQETPIMLANHIYWNLNGFKQGTILNDTTMWMPYSDRYIVVDPILIPTGALGSVSNLQAINFTSPKLFGTAVDNATGVCGQGCTGVDNAFIVDRPPNSGATSSSFPVLSLWSETTGIQLDVSTNQQGIQIYTCNGQNGTIPVKQSQQQRNNGTQGAAKFVNKYGCLAIEPQAYIDAVNHPEWGVNQYVIFSPTTGPAVNYATYDFSTF